MQWTLRGSKKIVELSHFLWSDLKGVHDVQMTSNGSCCCNGDYQTLLIESTACFTCMIKCHDSRVIHVLFQHTCNSFGMRLSSY